MTRRDMVQILLIQKNIENKKNRIVIDNFYDFETVVFNLIFIFNFQFYFAKFGNTEVFHSFVFSINKVLDWDSIIFQTLNYKIAILLSIPNPILFLNKLMNLVIIF